MDKNLEISDFGIYHLAGFSGVLQHRDVSVSVPTLLRILHQLHFSRKVVSACTLEHNELEHSMFMNRIAALVTDLAQLMSINKAACNSKTSAMDKTVLGGRVPDYVQYGSNQLESQKKAEKTLV